MLVDEDIVKLFSAGEEKIKKKINEFEERKEELRNAIYNLKDGLNLIKDITEIYENVPLKVFELDLDFLNNLDKNNICVPKGMKGIGIFRIPYSFGAKGAYLFKENKSWIIITCELKNKYGICCVNKNSVFSGFKTKKECLAKAKKFVALNELIEKI